MEEKDTKSSKKLSEKDSKKLSEKDAKIEQLTVRSEKVTGAALVRICRPKLCLDRKL